MLGAVGGVPPESRRSQMFATVGTTKEAPRSWLAESDCRRACSTASSSLARAEFTLTGRTSGVWHTLVGMKDES